MTDADQPLDPDDIPVVETDVLRASVRSARLGESVRCDLQTAAQSLQTLGKARVVVITPDSETNGGAATALARTLSNAAKTITIDMSAETVASMQMAGDLTHPGLKDVLAGDMKIADCIFKDRLSEAHIMPSGRTEARLSPESVPLLTVVLDALQSQYDYLFIDAGGAGAETLGRIADENSGIVISTMHAHNDEVDDRIVAIRRAGFEEPVIIEMYETTG